MAFRAHYWSNSKFADWIRGTPKIKYGTSSEWKEWKCYSRHEHPTRYWIAEEVLDKIQDFIHWPIDKLDSFAYWVYNRFISPTHLINTRLKKGQWHETDTKILHGMMEELVDFVEIQLASRTDKKYWFDRLPYFLSKFIVKRSYQNGIDHLLWEVNLVHDENWGYEKTNENYGKPTRQAEAALEKLCIYVWWKFIRPNRPDPMDASGLSAYYDRRRDLNKDDPDYSILDDLDVEEKGQDEIDHRAMSEKCFELEKQYDDEDESYMIRLIKVRHSLWT